MNTQYQKIFDLFNILFEKVITNKVELFNLTKN